MSTCNLPFLRTTLIPEFPVPVTPLNLYGTVKKRGNLGSFVDIHLLPYLKFLRGTSVPKCIPGRPTTLGDSPVYTRVQVTPEVFKVPESFNRDLPPSRQLTLPVCVLLRLWVPEVGSPFYSWV